MIPRSSASASATANICVVKHRWLIALAISMSGCSLVADPGTTAATPTLSDAETFWCTDHLASVQRASDSLGLVVHGTMLAEGKYSDFLQATYHDRELLPAFVGVSEVEAEANYLSACQAAFGASPP